MNFSRAGAVLIWLAVDLVPSTSFAQDCNALIAHGLRNIEVKHSSSAALATKYYRNCGLNFSSASDSVLANLEVEVFGYGSGSAGFSRAQREERLEQWCTTNKELAQSAQNEYVKSMSIMAEAVAAWSHCTELASRGVQTRPIISADQRTVSLSLSYTGPTNGVEFFGVAAENFDCDTKVPGMTVAQVRAAFEAGNAVLIKPAAISVECHRGVGSKAVGGQSYTWLDRGTISVRTASDPYQLFFPEETVPPMPEQVSQRIESDLALAKRMLPPIGAIMGFLLTPAEAAALAPYWLPADGRTVHDSQSPLDGRKLSDLSGRYLRGVPATQDASDESINLGGLNTLVINSMTENPTRGACAGGFSPEPTALPGWSDAFVIDTTIDEVACRHNHKINISVPFEPAHRGVIFLVRVR